MGSRGSVLPFFLELKNQNKSLTVTHKDMTRFMITLPQGVDLVWHAFGDMHGGEIYVKKIPSMNIMDIASCIDDENEPEIIGIRPGEKMHEQMIGFEDAPHTYEYKEHYKILPMINDWSKDPERIKDGKLVPKDFTYTSDNNSSWMKKSELSSWLEENKDKIGKI